MTSLYGLHILLGLSLLLMLSTPAQPALQAGHA